VFEFELPQLDLSCDTNHTIHIYCVKVAMYGFIGGSRTDIRNYCGFIYIYTSLFIFIVMVIVFSFFLFSFSGVLLYEIHIK